MTSRYEIDAFRDLSDISRNLRSMTDHTQQIASAIESDLIEVLRAIAESLSEIVVRMRDEEKDG